MKQSISILFLLVTTTFSFAQNKIDQDLEKCLSQRNSTAGQVSCVSSARDSWDKELNKSYLSLSQKLSKTGKSELVEAQRNWMKFRDSEFKLIDKYYFGVKKGTLFYVIAENKKLEIVKERALQLKEYDEQFDY
ncbi:lysozyme inhibitor LprI family protein [Epilithonimonas lactis]|uniref:Lysozyme inhibitor LprI-like N-terminal domain-containing protein n=1 Tax=Epilithonimonas lactis TaxID=421072 RepID=A0A085BL58_9FLAO|nr:lysozyme inhibitor LprI family protein [Epilithonimonas lactis]KFC23203.1 hypothetical protein IO89_00985 [Epilithonimonas lactis]SEQ05195.1 Protein of unknown function [Epilithonimonas lactis]